MTICQYCGKDIRFINRKGKKAIMVEKAAVYFLPDDSGNEYFVQSGTIRKGIRARDGLKGYKLHVC